MCQREQPTYHEPSYAISRTFLMHTYGVFVDPSEYRRNAFDFSGSRLTALADLSSRESITLLQTDVSILEVRTLIRRSIKDACDDLKKSTLVPLKSITDSRLDVFRSPPNADQLTEKLSTQFESHLEAGSCTRLSVSNVDPAIIFDAYFREQPPFDNARKRWSSPTLMRDPDSASGTDKLEIEANRFAAELLMPEWAVHRVLEREFD